MIPKTCISCGVVIDRGNRCTQHQRKLDADRNAKPTRQMYRDKVYRSYVLASRCRYCGSTRNLTKDHKVPLSKGGTNDPSNIQTLCLECNSAKGNTMQ